MTTDDIIPSPLAVYPTQELFLELGRRSASLLIVAETGDAVKAATQAAARDGRLEPGSVQGRLASVKVPLADAPDGPFYAADRYAHGVGFSMSHAIMDHLRDQPLEIRVMVASAVMHGMHMGWKHAMDASGLAADMGVEMDEDEDA